MDAFKGIVERNGLDTWPTKKNDQFLLDSGFTSDDVEEIVRKIEVRDYESGPHDDDKEGFRQPGEVWVFGKEYEGYDLYIKLKMTNGNAVIAECLSAHEAEFPMKLPMRARR